MINFQNLSVGGSAAHFDLTLIAGTKEAFITVEGNAVRVRYDGSDPTATVGANIAVGDVIHLKTYEQMKNFRAISQSVASPVVGANLMCHFENNDPGFRIEG